MNTHTHTDTHTHTNTHTHTDRYTNRHAHTDRHTHTRTHTHTHTHTHTRSNEHNRSIANEAQPDTPVLFAGTSRTTCGRPVDSRGRGTTSIGEFALQSAQLCILIGRVRKNSTVDLLNWLFWRPRYVLVPSPVGFKEGIRISLNLPISQKSRREIVLRVTESRV